MKLDYNLIQTETKNFFSQLTIAITESCNKVMKLKPAHGGRQLTTD